MTSSSDWNKRSSLVFLYFSRSSVTKGLISSALSDTVLWFLAPCSEENHCCRKRTQSPRLLCHPGLNREREPGSGGSRIPPCIAGTWSRGPRRVRLLTRAWKRMSSQCPHFLSLSTSRSSSGGAPEYHASSSRGKTMMRPATRAYVWFRGVLGSILFREDVLVACDATRTHSSPPHEVCRHQQRRRPSHGTDRFKFSCNYI